MKTHDFINNIEDFRLRSKIPLKIVLFFKIIEKKR